MNRREDDKQLLAVMVALSVLLHAALLPALSDALAPKSPSAKPMKTTRIVPLLEPANPDVSKRATTSKVSRPKPPIAQKAIDKKQVKKKPKDKPRGQVVEIAPPDKEQKPEKSDLLSEFNNRVEREQIDRRKAVPQSRVEKSDRRLISAGNDMNGSRDGKKKLSGENQLKTARSKNESRRDSANKKPQRKPRVQKRPKAVDRPSDRLPEGDGRFARERPQSAQPTVQPSEGGGDERPIGPSNWRALLPSLGAKSMELKLGSIDHVENMREGDGTFLNTRAYRHAWFFNRVKNSVGQRWRAADAHRRNDPRGRIYGVRDRLTVVQVTLSPHGDLDEILISKNSGVTFLDEAAIDAFRSAQPFPNPPLELQDADGQIRFKFGFFLEINSRNFQLFRAR